MVAIPIEEPPPLITGIPNPEATGPLTHLPSPGDLVEYTGRGAAAVWGDVWSWVKTTAAPAASTLANIEGDIASAVLNTIESYVGTSIAALSGFVDDLGATMDFVSGLTFDVIDTLAIEVEDSVTYLDRVVYGLLTEVIGIEGRIIPDIEQRLLDLGTATETFIHIGIGQVQAWAIDNIYDPLTADIWRVGVQAETDIRDGLTQVLDEAKAYADAHAAAIATAIAAAAAAAAAATEWIDDCGEPMCQVQGPKTDLGKLLKGLGLALDAALFVDLANAKEGDVADAITRIATKASDVIGTFERDFISGGSTLAGTITDELGQLV